MKFTFPQERTCYCSRWAWAKWRVTWNKWYVDCDRLQLWLTAHWWKFFVLLMSTRLKIIFCWAVFMSERSNNRVVMMNVLLGHPCVDLLLLNWGVVAPLLVKHIIMTIHWLKIIIADHHCITHHQLDHDEEPGQTQNGAEQREPEMETLSHLHPENGDDGYDGHHKRPDCNCHCHHCKLHCRKQLLSSVMATKCHASKRWLKMITFIVIFNIFHIKVKTFNRW